MSYQNILVETENYITTLTINRPKKLNALNRETLAEIHNAFVALETDEDTKVIIITGSGEKAFVAKIVPEASPPPPTGVII
jgi:enoyl-CoA hydratase